jgi:Acetyltransferase (GNAT) family
MTTTFAVADTPELREAAYRFRYEIYVARMGRRQIHADHVRRTVIEPLDETGRIFVALRDGEVVGTIRSNRANEDVLDYYRTLYRLDRFGFRDLSRIQITTKLMVRPDLVRSGLAIRMIQHYAANSAENGASVDFLDCNRPLISMFERMGYLSYCGWRVHKEYGTIRPMFLAIDTIDRQRALGSPLWESIGRHVKDGAYNGYDLFRKHGRPESLPIMGELAACA